MPRDPDTKQFLAGHARTTSRSWHPLDGLVCSLSGNGVATDYAVRLLRSLGIDIEHRAGIDDLHPALAWARSGAMALTGSPDKPGRMCPAPIASCLEGTLKALDALGGDDLIRPLPDCSLLGERATIAGHRRGGRVSAGGGCRLLSGANGWLALSLARPDDWQLLPAWLESGPLDSWAEVADLVGNLPVDALLERGRMLGLAIATATTSTAQHPPRPAQWCRLLERSRRADARVRRRGTPLVVDLSSLWAGPLCAQLLGTLGARVVKVESLGRPDGARRGPAAFDDLMNAGKASVALDFSSPGGIDKLRRLLLVADIVVESARPRALQQLGIDASAILAENPRLTWLSITGHGRTGDQADWIAYGDDAGVAAGLTSLMLDATGEMMFCGDAIADPLTGVHAALAAWSAYRAGGGVLVSLSLIEVIRHCLAFAPTTSLEATRRRWRRWQDLAVAAGGSEQRAAIRSIAVPARPLGADNTTVLTAFGIPC